MQAVSPAAALGLFDLEEFSFGAPPASYRDSTPGLLMDQTLGAPSALQDIEVPSVNLIRSLDNIRTCCTLEQSEPD